MRENRGWGRGHFGGRTVSQSGSPPRTKDREIYVGQSQQGVVFRSVDWKAWKGK